MVTHASEPALKIVVEAMADAMEIIGDELEGFEIPVPERVELLGYALSFCVLTAVGDHAHHRAAAVMALSVGIQGAHVNQLSQEG